MRPAPTSVALTQRNANNQRDVDTVVHLRATHFASTGKHLTRGHTMFTPEQVATQSVWFSWAVCLSVAWAQIRQ